jgi:exodeoxyribonuclease VII small subunit
MTQKKPAHSLSYSDLKQQLNLIIDQLSGDEISIDEAIVLYGNAQSLLDQLKKYLTEQKNKINILS